MRRRPAFQLGVFRFSFRRSGASVWRRKKRYRKEASRERVKGIGLRTASFTHVRRRRQEACRACGRDLPFCRVGRRRTARTCVRPAGGSLQNACSGSSLRKDTAWGPKAGRSGGLPCCSAPPDSGSARSRAEGPARALREMQPSARGRLRAADPYRIEPFDLL